MFLSIGFIQPHKGFDRAIRAFGRLGGTTGDGRPLRLDVVGSVRLEDPAYVEHVDTLRGLSDATPGTGLHLGYVSDEEFDRWIVAADVIVLPYRHIWSSGVIERAALYDRPVIVTRVGGLAAQARADTVVVETDDELAEAMRDAAGIEAPPRPGWDLDASVDRERVMAEIRARASRERPPALAASVSHPSASQPLRRLPPLPPPPATSARPGAALLKRLQRRLTGWQIDPLVAQVNRLREAAIETAERLETRS
jgi:glycosyltransferase involved in cell wall biosynthesis